MTFSYKSGTAGLTFDITEEQIRDHFSQFGHVTDVQRDDRDYSFACLTFEDTDSVDKVKTLTSVCLSVFLSVILSVCLSFFLSACLSDRRTA